MARNRYLVNPINPDERYIINYTRCPHCSYDLRPLFKDPGWNEVKSKVGAGLGITLTCPECGTVLRIMYHSDKNGRVSGYYFAKKDRDIEFHEMIKDLVEKGRK